MRIKKYGKLFLSLAKTSMVSDLEFRINFLTRIVTDIFWYLAQILVFETLYVHTSVVGTWNVHQTRVFLGVLFVVDALYMIFFSENLDNFTEKVRKGDMDLLLAKPVNSQFFLSFYRFNTAILGNLAISVSWLIWALLHLPDFQWARLWWLLLLIPVGLSFLYVLRFMFSTSAIIFTKADNLQFIWYQFYKLATRPDSIYVPWLKFVLMTVIPVTAIASLPSHALFEPPDFGVFLGTAVLSVFFLWLSHRFWNFALKFYSSASS